MSEHKLRVNADAVLPEARLMSEDEHIAAMSDPNAPPTMAEVDDTINALVRAASSPVDAAGIVARYDALRALFARAIEHGKAAEREAEDSDKDRAKMQARLQRAIERPAVDVSFEAALDRLEAAGRDYDNAGSDEKGHRAYAALAAARAAMLAKCSEVERERDGLIQEHRYMVEVTIKELHGALAAQVARAANAEAERDQTRDYAMTEASKIRDEVAALTAENERLRRIEAEATDVCAYIVTHRNPDNCPMCRLRAALAPREGTK